MQTTYPSIPSTLTFVQTQYPVLQEQEPTTVIVESMEEVDIVSYIYESKTEKKQVVTIFNKDTKETTLV